MTNQATKVRNGKISFTLPQELQKAWRKADVFIAGEEDTIVLKRVEKSTFWKTWEKMKEASKGITEDDINEAIASARK